MCCLVYLVYEDKRQNFNILEKTVSPALDTNKLVPLDHLAEKPVKSYFDGISFSDF